MFNRESVKRLDEKSPMHAIQVELQQGYALSPVEAQGLDGRLSENGCVSRRCCRWTQPQGLLRRPVCPAQRYFRRLNLTISLPLASPRAGMPT
jgi:hypothetical protein